MRHLGRWLITLVVLLHLLGCSGDPNPAGMPKEGPAPLDSGDVDRLKNQFSKPTQKQ